ncbi:MAG: hypothetical protein HC806_05530 [Anaerolineae bacterium]|nr:hypothetical protein [Anaerolineae bacterium]
MADGRVYTGRQALELGLIDAVGYTQDAISKAATLGLIAGEPRIIRYSTEIGFLSLLGGVTNPDPPGAFCPAGAFTHAKNRIYVGSMKYTFIHNGKPHELTLIPTPDGYRVTYRDGEHTLTDVETTPDRIRFRLNDVVYTLPVSVDGDTRWVAFDGNTYELKRESRSRRSRAAGDDKTQGTLRAPMPGQVRSVNIEVGDSVTKGQTLLLLEAMKMEIRIQAPSDGTVAKIGVGVGDQVEKEQTLVEIQ